MKNPYLVSQVFKNGAIIKSIKTPYSKVLPQGAHPDRLSVRQAMEIQHQRILDLLSMEQVL